eukprot:4062785-Pyramimonas_sp.AAC.1
MTSTEKEWLYSGEMDFPVQVKRWRRIALRLITFTAQVRLSLAMAELIPMAFKEEHDPVELCQHPAWARRSGSNSTSVCTHCSRC